MERPVIRCFAAWMYGAGKILGQAHCVTLEEAEVMMRQGYTIVGPDQHDLHELATWERERREPELPRGLASWLRRTT